MIDNDEHLLWEAYTESIANPVNIRNAEEGLKRSVSRQDPREDIMVQVEFIKKLREELEGPYIKDVTQRNEEVAQTAGRVRRMIDKLLRRS